MFNFRVFFLLSLILWQRPLEKSCDFSRLKFRIVLVIYVCRFELLSYIVSRTRWIFPRYESFLFHLQLSNLSSSFFNRVIAIFGKELRFVAIKVYLDDCSNSTICQTLLRNESFPLSSSIFGFYVESSCFSSPVFWFQSLKICADFAIKKP